MPAAEHKTSQQEVVSNQHCRIIAAIVPPFIADHRNSTAKLGIARIFCRAVPDFLLLREDERYQCGITRAHGDVLLPGPRFAKDSTLNGLLT